MAYIRKHRVVFLAALVAALMMLVPVAAAARVFVGFGFPIYPYGYWGPYPGYYGYPGPYGYGYPGPYGNGYGYRSVGEVKIKSPEPEAEIYINGALVGRAHHLKHFYLRPGTYRIEQRIGDDVQKTRIYVLANRTVRVEFGPIGSQPIVPEPLPPPEEEEHENHENHY